MKRIPDEYEMPFFPKGSFKKELIMNPNTLRRLFPNMPSIFPVIYISIFLIHFLVTFGLFYFGMFGSGTVMLVLGTCLLIPSIILLKKIDRLSRERDIKFLNEMERDGKIADREIEEILERKFGPRR